MKIPRNHLAIICLVLVMAILSQTEGNPEPGRRSSRSRSRSTSGRSGYSNTNTNSRSSWGSSNSRNSKGSRKGMSTLKKAAVVGAVAYGSYQLGKATSRFGHYRHGGSWGYNDYDRWRQQDGMLCRSNKDCIWMDSHMFCTDYEFDFSISRSWYGGDWMSVRGKCECPRSMHWDNWELQCQRNLFGPIGGIGALISMILISCCCCGGCIGLYFYKRRN